MVDPQRLLGAYRTARQDLLDQREAAGHWTGELSSSALSTATAVSALALVERHGETDDSGCFKNEAREAQYSQLIMRGLHWLAANQNADGGWGDTDKSYSNIATTMLVRAAFQLTGVPNSRADLLDRANAYIKAAGGLPGLRKRYGKDKTFAVPILTNCALAGCVPWREVSPLPFELACLPQKFLRFVNLPVVSYALPALIAIGQARFHHRKPWNPIARLIRSATLEKSLAVLERMQPESGGYLEATPLTSFVVMSLAGSGRADHRVVQRGVGFLIESVRADGSWPIDTNLATWTTSLSLGALAAGGEDIRTVASLDWLLGCQHRQVHPFTGAEPGGWGWTDLSGAVPDADDTPAALLALAAWLSAGSTEDDARIEAAAASGVEWLLNLQNRDGGWPTFCRGWGALPFDRSGTDLTAHALRALDAWRGRLAESRGDVVLDRRIAEAMQQGLRFLARQQREDGSWVPLWFGNQDHPDEENPVYGTSRVLLAYRDLGRMDAPSAQRAVAWLVAQQNADGGWGGRVEALPKGKTRRHSSVEETAVAVEALLGAASSPGVQTALSEGLGWLIEAVEAGRHVESSPIGFYFARLWYHEKLYPRIFSVSALGHAVRTLLPRPELKPVAAHSDQA